MSCGYEGSITIIYKDGTEEWAGWSNSDRFYTCVLGGDEAKERLKNISSGKELMEFVFDRYFQEGKSAMEGQGREYREEEVEITWHNEEKLLNLCDFSNVEKIKIRETMEDYSGYAPGGSTSKTLSKNTNKHISKKK